MYPKLNVALVVPAIRNDCFDQCGKTSKAYAQLNKLLIIRNTSDFTMRVFRFYRGDDCNLSLGRAGASCVSRLPDGGQKICQINVSNLVRKHKLTDHLSQPSIRQYITQCLFGDQDEKSEDTILKPIPR